MHYRLFRDPAVAEETQVADPIAIMASQGRLIQPDESDDSIPVINTQTATKPTSTEMGSGQEQKPAVVQDQKPPVETKPAVEANKPAQQTMADWREVLKQQPDTEVLKALGLDPSVVDFVSKRKQLDPKISKFVDHWEAKGNVQEYLDAMTTDYSKMTDEDVMKRQLQQEVKDMGLDLTKEEFEDLYNTRVIEQYKLNPDMFAEKETKTGRLNLKMDAAKARKEFVAKQQEYLLAAPPERQLSEIEQQYTEREKQTETAITDYVNYMSGAPEVKDLFQTKILKIGEGDEAFSYGIENPAETLDLLFDTKKYTAKLLNEAGAWDTRKHMIMAALVDDTDGFLSKFAAHHQEIGKSKAIEPIVNATGNTGGTPAQAETRDEDPAAVMARSGKLVSG